MREDKLLQLREFAKLVQVWMVNDQVESYVGQVHLLHHVVELWAGEHLQGVPVDVEDTIALDLGVAALHQALVAVVLSLQVLRVCSILLRVQAFSLPVPLFLDDLDHSVLLRLALGSRVARLTHWNDVFRDNAGAFGRRRWLSHVGRFLDRNNGLVASYLPHAELLGDLRILSCDWSYLWDLLCCLGACLQELVAQHQVRALALAELDRVLLDVREIDRHYLGQLSAHIGDGIAGQGQLRQLGQRLLGRLGDLRALMTKSQAVARQRSLYVDLSDFVTCKVEDLQMRQAESRHIDLERRDLVPLEQNGLQLRKHLEALDQVERAADLVVAQVDDLEVHEGLDVLDLCDLV